MPEGREGKGGSGTEKRLRVRIRNRCCSCLGVTRGFSTALPSFTGRQQLGASPTDATSPVRAGGWQWCCGALGLARQRCPGKHALGQSCLQRGLGLNVVEVLGRPGAGHNGCGFLAEWGHAAPHVASDRVPVKGTATFGNFQCTTARSRPER